MPLCLFTRAIILLYDIMLIYAIIVAMPRRFTQKSAIYAIVDAAFAFELPFVSLAPRFIVIFYEPRRQRYACHGDADAQHAYAMPECHAATRAIRRGDASRRYYCCLRC